MMRAPMGGRAMGGESVGVRGNGEGTAVGGRGLADGRRTVRQFKLTAQKFAMQWGSVMSRAMGVCRVQQAGSVSREEGVRDAGRRLCVKQCGRR